MRSMPILQVVLLTMWMSSNRLRPHCHDPAGTTAASVTMMHRRHGPIRSMHMFFADCLWPCAAQRFKFRLWRQDGADKPLPKVIPTIPLHGLRVLVD